MRSVALGTGFEGWGVLCVGCERMDGRDMVVFSATGVWDLPDVLHDQT